MWREKSLYGIRRWASVIHLPVTLSWEMHSPTQKNVCPVKFTSTITTAANKCCHRRVDMHLSPVVAAESVERRGVTRHDVALG